MILIIIRHIQVLSAVLFVCAVPSSSGNTTTSNRLSSVNTTHGISTVPSVSSVTEDTGSTGDESHGSTGDIYTCAISTNKNDVYIFQAYSNANL